MYLITTNLYIETIYDITLIVSYNGKQRELRQSIHQLAYFA